MGEDDGLTSMTKRRNYGPVPQGRLEFLHRLNRRVISYWPAEDNRGRTVEAGIVRDIDCAAVDCIIVRAGCHDIMGPRTSFIRYPLS